MTYFTVLFGHEGQKPLELRCEEEVDGDEWVEAIHQASYSDILIEREVLMQKYIHLVQIVETEKISANQLRHQLEDQDTEIERLKSEGIRASLLLQNEKASHLKAAVTGWLPRKLRKQVVASKQGQSTGHDTRTLEKRMSSCQSFCIPIGCQDEYEILTLDTGTAVCGQEAATSLEFIALFRGF
uniref:Ras-specific guanine nucleotide-releasing factor 2 n=1 Tax=Sphaerodactylus townsendi TaxID=933632 RepID=A0ACB8ERA0_9SAUR